MADDDWKKRLNDSGYKNWLKVSLALIESKEALHDFTESVIVALHNGFKTSIITRIGSGIIPVCTGTPTCNTRKGGVTGTAPTCSSCKEWVTEIKKQNKEQLHWKNADPTKWHNEPWEIAKCFMNAQGSKATAAANTGPTETDLSGMLNVLVNCKDFGDNHLNDKTLPKCVRKVRNDLMHCATMSLSDMDMQVMVSKVIALLEDDKELKHLKISQEKVEIIKSLRDSEFELKPKDEEICIETALESHVLDAESGDEVDKIMMSKLRQFIRENKDLERKFDDKVNKIDKKLTNMQQEYDVKFSEVSIILDGLKGKVEFLEKKLASGQSFSSVGSEIKSFYKNVLQNCAQKKKLVLPEYKTNEIEGKMFVSIVCFDGKKFNSEPKPSKKEAEQNAAEEALKFLGNEDSEVSNEKNESPASAEHPIMDSTLSTQQKGKNYKNLLQERAQKQKIPLPIYFKKETNTGFLYEVMYDGRTYSPDISPQNRKVDAQQKAAQFVLTYLDSELERSAPTSGNPSPAQPDNVRDEVRRDVSPTCAKNMSKQFKVILNEHMQKVTKGQLPDYKTEKNSDGKFVCTVTVFGNPYKSPSGMNSIPDAKESAAKEACIVLHLGEAVSGNSPGPTDLDSAKEEKSVIEATSDENDGATPRTCSKKITADATSTSNASPYSVDRPGGKTYKSKLNEYAQKMGAKTPEYKDIPGSDDKNFRSKVTVLDKTFECPGSYTSKKTSHEMAAMEAMKFFDGLLADNSSAISESSIDSKKIEQENESPTTVAKGKTIRDFSLNTPTVISTQTNAAGKATESIEPGVKQASDAETVKLPSEATVLDNSTNEISVIEPTSDETDGATSRTCLTKMTTDATSTSNANPYSVDKPDGKTYKSMLNEYAQKMQAKTPEYKDIPGSDDKNFRSKVTVLDKTFECPGFYTSKKMSQEMAAMEAMKFFDGLLADNSSGIPESPIDSKKMEQENESPTTVAKGKATRDFSSDTTTVISTEASAAEKATGNIESGKEQESDAVTVKLPGETKVSDNPDRRQTPTPKTPANSKSALHEYVKKRKLDQSFRYVNTKDPTTNNYLSKVFVGKRCFKGKQPKPKIKEAEKHVAEVALNILEGQNSEPDRKCEELLIEYHKRINFPTFPKYEEAPTSEGGMFNANVKVKKKYEFVCKDKKPKKKDVELSLADQAVTALQEEKKMTSADGNAKSRLNQFLQSQDGESNLNYDVPRGQTDFTGCLCFYVVEVYESLTPQQTKEEAKSSATMSACNGLDLH